MFVAISPLSALSVKSCEGIEQIADHNYFVIGYDEDTECPLYVEYTLSSDEARELGSVERTDRFRADPYIVTGSATPSDYKGSGYDRGHMFPSYHGTFCYDANDYSFYMSNMCPQTHSCNAGAWKTLEMRVVELAKDYGDVERVCGPIFDDNKPAEWIGKKNKVRVPDRFFNVISYKKYGETVIECTIVTNGYGDDVKSTNAKLSTIERLTGIKFNK